MVRYLARSVLFLVLLSAVGAYLFYLKTGSFPSLEKGWRDSADDTSVDLHRLSEMPPMNSVAPEDSSETIKKWQDENGVWHFSNQ